MNAGLIVISRRQTNGRPERRRAPNAGDPPAAFLTSPEPASRSVEVMSGGVDVSNRRPCARA
jgi:hypothetical protein